MNDVENRDGKKVRVYEVDYHPYGEDDEEKYYDYLKENNAWAQTLEAKNVNIVNYQNIIENIKVGKEEFTCGKDEDLIKTFDVFLKTSTSTSRNSKII